MANAGFDGSTVKWTKAAGVQKDLSPLINFKYDDSPPVVDITGCVNTTHLALTGRNDETMTADFLGMPDASLRPGFKGALAVSLFDGGDEGTLADVICLSLSIDGRIDDKVSCTATFQPCNA